MGNTLIFDASVDIRKKNGCDIAQYSFDSYGSNFATPPLYRGCTRVDTHTHMESMTHDVMSNTLLPGVTHHYLNF